MNTGNLNILRRGTAQDRPLYVGIVACYFLWGIQITQSYYYYKTYRATDRAWIKWAVGLLFIADAIQTVCISEGGWSYLVEASDDEEFRKIRSWGLDVVPLPDAATTAIVHAFYAHKIWVLLTSPHNQIWTVIVLCLSGLQLGGGVAAAAFGASPNDRFISTTAYHAKVASCIWLATASVTDIIITLLLYMKLSRSRTGVKDTDDIVSKIIRFIVETGLATATMQILNLVLYLGWRMKGYHGVITFISAKVYSNSMLALLNSRQSPRFPTNLPSSQETEMHVGGIQIQTTQSISTRHDYELKDLQTQALNKSQSNKGSYMGDVDISFSHKDDVIKVNV